MADVIITLKIMPTSPEIDLDNLEKAIKEKISNFGGEVGKVELEPVAFGLKALKIIFVSDENKGGTDSLENEINSIKGVNSVDVADTRRAIG